MAAYRPSVRVGEIFAETFAVARRNCAALAAFTLGMGAVTGALAYLMDESMALVVELAVSYAAGYALVWRVLDAEGFSTVSGWTTGIGAYFVSSLIILIAAGLGLILLVLPGLVLLARWSLVVPLIVGRGFGTSAALAESSRLTRDAMWPVVGFLAVAGGAFLVVLSLVGGYAVFSEATVGAGGMLTHFMDFVSYGLSGLFSLSSVALFGILGDRDEQVAEVFA